MIRRRDFGCCASLALSGRYALVLSSQNAIVCRFRKPFVLAVIGVRLRQKRVLRQEREGFGLEDGLVFVARCRLTKQAA